MVFDDEFFTVTIIREGTIPPNCKDLLQSISLSNSTYNINLNDTWFNPYLESHPIETPRHEPIVAPDNNNKVLKAFQSEPHIHEYFSIKGEPASEIYKLPVFKGVYKTSKLNKIVFDQNPSNDPSVIPYR